MLSFTFMHKSLYNFDTCFQVGSAAMSIMHSAFALIKKVIVQPKWIENFVTHSARISAPNSRRGSKVVPEREFGEYSLTACRKLQICLGADRPCHLRAQVWEIHKLRWDPKQPKFIKNQYHCIKQCWNAYMSLAFRASLVHVRPYFLQ